MEKRALEIEKLKAALGESLTQEEIEKKLKEKLENTNNETIKSEVIVEKIVKQELVNDETNESENIDKINDEIIKESEEVEEISEELESEEVDEKSIDSIEEPEDKSADFEIQVEEISAEKLAILNKRRMEDLKANKKSSINIVIYLFSFIAILLIIFAAYLFMNKPAVKEVVVYKKSEPKEIIKEVVKEKIVPATPLDDKQLKSYFNSNKYEIYKCYDFKVGVATFPNECKKPLEEFLAKNKDSFKLEITGVVSPDDIALVKKVNLGDASPKMREYIVRGFSRERVLETSFYIRDVLKDDVILTPVNYYVTSKKVSKGVIIKAYYLEKQ
ncbi:hypothetical protein Arnit_1323 [Arcobacter nitrofigilis DSM 7299]|uniref:Uncharacterized protein n=1 Tax=Arcobacter nitrofigilis (strain ATCC 33309 / DSM 7299 / CCUG 15893 / LMG 7604 / NCTC 12251 / CI) TaxID=572480 RepID=D5V4S6_ARCNC|nr:hypothetical protein [Arcobacter nitrofigilis]ADG92981.1 hypothetical protein Arnit_1323 [Arcobacter nitrofigilis DSM 7299]